MASILFRDPSSFNSFHPEKEGGVCEHARIYNTDRTYFLRNADLQDKRMNKFIDAHDKRSKKVLFRRFDLEPSENPTLTDKERETAVKEKRNPFFHITYNGEDGEWDIEDSFAFNIFVLPLQNDLNNVPLFDPVNRDTKMFRSIDAVVKKCCPWGVPPNAGVFADSTFLFRMKGVEGRWITEQDGCHFLFFVFVVDFVDLYVFVQ